VTDFSFSGAETNANGGTFVPCPPSAPYVLGGGVEPSGTFAQGTVTVSYPATELNGAQFTPMSVFSGESQTELVASGITMGWFGEASVDTVTVDAICAK
jgi:hypothetical protein